MSAKYFDPGIISKSAQHTTAQLILGLMLYVQDKKCDLIWKEHAKRFFEFII